jgi:hypothetical protein
MVIRECNRDWRHSAGRALRELGKNEVRAASDALADLWLRLRARSSLLWLSRPYERPTLFACGR